jgi:lysine biosynthesis protein LysW
MQNNSRAVAVCPDCQSTINLPPNPELWMRITCPECGTQLEIVDDSPWELDYTEDMDDDEDTFTKALDEEEDYFPDDEDEDI